MSEKNTQSTENPEIVIPEFLTMKNNKKENDMKKSVSEKMNIEEVNDALKDIPLEEETAEIEKPVVLQYIKDIPDDKKSWKVIKELDSLISSLLANDTEPVNCNIRYKYTTMSESGSRKENVKGSISTSL